MKNKSRIPPSLLCLSLLLISVYGNTNNAAAGQDTIWKFAVISDTQGDNRIANDRTCINEKILSSIAADIAAEKPDLVLVSGDLVNGWIKNGGTDYAFQYANWKKAMKPVSSMGIPILAVRGNHDSGPERLALPPLPQHLEPRPGSLIRLEQEYKKAIIGSYIPRNGPEKEKGLTYAYVHKNACVIALDQYSGGQHRVNQEWLDRQLSRNTQVHLFVFGHEPAFEANHKDNLSFYPDRRDRFWDSIGKAGGRIYFCGHDHFYNRALIPDGNGNPLRQIIGGTGGGRLRKWSGFFKERGRAKCEYYNNDHHGYILVTIDGPMVKVEWKAIVDISARKWRVLDTFTYSAPAKQGKIAR